MRYLKYLLSHRALEQIYFVFIHPLIEYGDVLCDGCGLMNEVKLNNIQYEAAKIETVPNEQSLPFTCN